MKSGGLLVYAPVAPTEECIALVNELNAPVEYILLPTTLFEHKLFMGPFQVRYALRRRKSCGETRRCRSRRPPIPLTRMVARTQGYTYDAHVWDLSIVQGPFSVAPCQTLIVRFVTFASL